MPKLSIVMPVFNQDESYLRTAIESILDQSFDDFEFIIIDDGSTDATCLGILDRFSKADARVRLIRNESNSGIVHSLNKALSTASGTYIARMDSDDFSLPERMEKQLAFLERNPDHDLVGSWTAVMDEKGCGIGAIKPPTDSRSIRNAILLGNPIMHPTWMFRASLLDEVGTYDPNAGNAEDYEFLLRIAMLHKIANVPEMLLKYRFNTNGLSFKNNKVQERNALRMRLKALNKYGYPAWNAIHILRPLLIYLLVPSALKLRLLKKSFKTA